MNRFQRTVAVNDMAIIARDPTVIVMFILLPLAAMSILAPLTSLALQDSGFVDANGSEQVVPGMATMFAYFAVTFLGMSMLDERNNNTWIRLRASPATLLDLYVGKGFTPFALAVAQQTVLFILGALFLGLRFQGSILGAVLVGISFCLSLVSLGMVVVSVTSSPQQVSVLANLSLLIFGGFGGALAPIEVMPSWAQQIAPLTPGYWAITGYRRFVLTDAGVGQSAVPILVLLSMSAALGALAIRRLQGEGSR